MEVFDKFFCQFTGCFFNDEINASKMISGFYDVIYIDISLKFTDGVGLKY